MADLADIVMRLEPVLGAAGSEPVPLTGGITNLNYRVKLGDRDYVVRLPGKDTALLGISREAEREANAAAARLGLAPAVAAALDDCLVTDFVECRQLTSAELCAQPGPVATALRTFHDRGPALPARFWVPDLIERYAEIVARRDGSLPERYGQARELARRIADALPLVEEVPCHDDLLAANIIDAGERTMLVDWEYAGMGARLFDLGNLSVNNEFDAAADHRMLHAYCGREPGEPLLAALALMRVMSDIREAAWGVVQCVLSELDFDFGAYAESHFDRMARNASEPHFEEWLHAAAA